MPPWSKPLPPRQAMRWLLASYSRGALAGRRRRQTVVIEEAAVATAHVQIGHGLAASELRSLPSEIAHQLGTA